MTFIEKTTSFPSPRNDLVRATRPQKVEAYPQDWVKAAQQLAQEFAQGAVQRDLDGTRPVEQIRGLRESGLVSLLYPKALGGGGGSLQDAAQSVLEIAKVDGSTAALLGFNYYNSLVPLLTDYTGANDDIVRHAADNRFFWGNVTQYVNKEFVAQHHPDGGFTITGTKKWNTGAPLAEVTTLLAIHPDQDRYIYAVIPTAREGLEFHNDWDPIGLRGTDSGTITFHNVRILPQEVLHWGHSPAQTGPLPLWASFGAIFYTAVFIGRTLGALEQVREWVLRGRRQGSFGGVSVSADDPFIQAEFAEYWVQVQAAQAYFDRTIAFVQSKWDQRSTLTDEDYGAIALETLSLRTFAARTALHVTPRVFELLGGRSTAREADFDQYWRDVRTLSSHDPEVLARRVIGKHVLHDEPLVFPPHFKNDKAL
ncbi:acyl-CoA dehydrogenase family protein [Acetobacter lambici]|uniref:Dibenzothiophene monooxygenase n=1 Tax=Acetobacter lambici TaxID=1332824 RepID=A0ABT1F1W8_9PROT|nr:acyl-CoA dehydrogenase family protein [Acetobacter lambici]MCP1243080.1 acyl-CoA dehydrogenase family protein [Acetobacter lambici]MCP1259202.1 acyl-CoA dehydrogenase family protein [Acetobacter lambici]